MAGAVTPITQISVRPLITPTLFTVSLAKSSAGKGVLKDADGYKLIGGKTPHFCGLHFTESCCALTIVATGVAGCDTSEPNCRVASLSNANPTHRLGVRREVSRAKAHWRKGPQDRSDRRPYGPFG
jgi:hypothetical protein